VKGCDTVEEQNILHSFNLFGFHVNLTSGIIVQWVIILVALVGCMLLTQNLKAEPDKKQTTLEWFVGVVNNLVKENMGESYVKFFVPYIGTLIVYLIIMNLTGLVGVEPPTSDLSITAGMGISTFIVIQSYTIKKIGLGHYLKGYTHPMPMLLPLNIMERGILPVSLTLRLFGNMTAGTVILGMVYGGLKLFAVVIPVPLHFYFDVFDGGIQMVIFIMLTMINMKVIAEH
jgi:F-type H+-transporting ATPase subunit a